MEKKTIIAVADDDVSVRELLCNHINTLKNCQVVIQTDSGQLLLENLKSNPEINLIILDIMMNELNGYETAAALSIQYPALRILFYSMCKTELAITKMISSGGHGLISKWKSSSAIKTAIKTVMSGYYFYPDFETGIIIEAQPLLFSNDSGYIQLSPTETEFLKLSSTEKTYKEIASILKIEVRQVDYIRETLFRRLNVKNRVGLAILAYQSGILSLQTDTNSFST